VAPGIANLEPGDLGMTMIEALKVREELVAISGDENAP
jgi:hypothetical protein